MGRKLKGGATKEIVEVAHSSLSTKGSGNQAKHLLDGHIESIIRLEQLT